MLQSANRVSTFAHLSCFVACLGQRGCCLLTCWYVSGKNVLPFGAIMWTNLLGGLEQGGE